MGKPTFRSFNDVVRELEDVYGHKELWLYSERHTQRQQK
jgi:hypothetical protein